MGGTAHIPPATTVCPMVRSDHRNVASLAVAAAVALGVLLTACGSNPVDDPVQDDAEVYRTVIGDLVARSGVVFPPSEKPPVLFVEALGVDGIDLEVQVAVVTAWVERYEIRFIDDRGEAIDPDLEGFPVREGSLLLGLGLITRNGTAEMRGETYLSQSEVRAFRYELLPAGSRWTIVGDPEAVEPEGLVTTP
jgi:hypothetical protein